MIIYVVNLAWIIAESGQFENADQIIAVTHTRLNKANMLDTEINGANYLKYPLFYSHASIPSPRSPPPQ